MPTQQLTEPPAPREVTVPRAVPSELIEAGPSKATVFLLSCGIAAPLLYVATDILLAIRWDGYSYRDQTISELNAIGSPTRTLSIVLGIIGYAFVTAFGVGVWRSAATNRRLRVAAYGLVALGVLGSFGVPFFPMHIREAEETLTDTLHVAQLAIAGPLLLVIIGFGAAAFGWRFRLYSGATVLVALAFGMWAGRYGADLANDLATPWVGIIERISVFAYQLWVVVFAIALLGLARARPAQSHELRKPSDGYKSRAGSASRRARVAAFLLIAGLVAGPIGTHVYWMLGGTWGLGRSTTTIGIQVVAAAVVTLLVGAVLVVLARVGVWRQAFVSDGVIRFLAWALAVFFLGHGLLSFTEGLVWSLDEWWLYGPSGLVIGLLALVVASSGGAWRIHRPHPTLPSH